jgi:cytoskeletal protein RodZ
MNKKLIAGFSALLVIGLAGGGYVWWIKSHQAQAPVVAARAITDIQDTVDSINQRAVQDMYSTATAEPTVDIPNVNPYRNTNPFSDIKTNPFK